MQTDYGFYFEKAGMSAVQGPTSSAEEHFKEISIAESLVREMGQNSLDAKAPGSDSTVRMEFELRKLNVGEIPDFQNLYEHVLAANESTRHIDATNDRLAVAANAVKEDSLFVLRIGDYGTTGLTGREDDESNNSPLVALTRARGVSAGKIGKGGSFGVGASTGALSSAIRTVLWMSLPLGCQEVVFAGQSQLATHELNGTKYGPDGFFINRSDLTRFQYLRSPDPLGSYSPRTEPGTDTFILGYLDAERDPHLLRIRDAFIRHFFVAIDRGNLEVEGRSPEGEWRLDSKTLEEVIISMDGMYPFYKALRNEPFEEEIDGLGNLKLFMEFDDQLPKKLDTIAMRSPLMRVTSFTHHSIRAKYAAVFICESEPGNTKLRKLEPPAHDKWMANRSDDGKQTITRVKEFIKKGLKTQLKEDFGEEISVPEMDKLLPAGIGNPGGDFSNLNGKPADRQDGSAESSTVHGSGLPIVAKKTERASFRVSTRKEGAAGGADDGLAGRRGGGRSKQSDGGMEPTVGQPGKGAVSIKDANLTMRSWTESRTGDLVIVLRGSAPAEGSLTLVALSDGGVEEKDFSLPIREVYAENQGTLSPLEHQGNTIKGIVLKEPDLSATIRLKLTNMDRFRLGVL